MLGNQQLKRSEEAISFILCGILEMAGNEAKSNISCIYSGIGAESAVLWRKIHSQSAIGGSVVGVPYAVKAADADTLGGKSASVQVTAESQMTAAPEGAGKKALATTTGGVAANATGPRKKLHEYQA